MSPEPTPKRWHIARVAHVSGDVAWWVFVVARLMAEMNTSGLPRRYADYEPPAVFGIGLGHVDAGWTAYTPLTDHPAPGLSDRFLSADIMSAWVIGALVLVVIAAVVEAGAVGRWPVGAGTIAAPIIGATVVLTALYERTGSFTGGVQPNLVAVFALVLIGIAIRQVWSQAVAPRPIHGS